MSIVKQIHALTEKLTGQTGAGYDITESINDLTKKWTGSSDRGETIAESLDVLVDHAESGGGGGGGEVPIFVAHQDMTVTCETSYSDFVSILKSAGLKDTSEINIYPCVFDMHEVEGGDSVLTAILSPLDDSISANIGNGYAIFYDEKGISVEEQ